jgi:hypothetical protein
MMVRLLSYIVLAVALAAPAFAQNIKTKTIEVTIVSVPPGATILMPNGSATAPTMTKVAVPLDCKNFGTTTIRWVSGAEATLTPTRLCPTPNKQTLTFTRPTGVDGLELDVQYGLQWIDFLQRSEQARQEAILGILSGMRITMPQVPMPTPLPRSLPSPQPVTCTSVLLGTIVQTTCQ